MSIPTGPTAEFVNVSYNTAPPTVVTNTGNYAQVGGNAVTPYIEFVLPVQRLCVEGHGAGVLQIRGPEATKPGAVDLRPRPVGTGTS